MGIGDEKPRTIIFFFSCFSFSCAHTSLWCQLGHPSTLAGLEHANPISSVEGPETKPLWWCEPFSGLGLGYSGSGRLLKEEAQGNINHREKTCLGVVWRFLLGERKRVVFCKKMWTKICLHAIKNSKVSSFFSLLFFLLYIRVSNVLAACFIVGTCVITL
jgi:hypothetical protein